MTTPGYYAILPANVRYDKALKPMEKIMFAEITALSNKDGYCTAGNNYFAELYEVDKKTVGRWIRNLEKGNHISIDQDDITGHNRKLYPRDKKITPPVQKDHPPRDKKITHNNTSIILQENNKGESTDSPTPGQSKDKFHNLPELKTQIGPKHYDLLNEVCQQEETYQVLRSLWTDKRFELLAEFLEYKKKIRKGYRSAAGIRKQIETFAEYTYHELRLALDDTIRNEWQSINPKKNRGKVKELFNRKKAL